MILFIEAVAIHGFLFFMWLGQACVDYSCFWITPEAESMNDSNQSVMKSEQIVVPVAVEQVAVQKTVAKVLKPIQMYEESALTSEQDSFFTMFAESINQVEVSSQASATGIVDKLSMEQWKEETEAVDVTPKLASIANAKIKDCIIGEQLWVVEVIGEEQDFLHVSDGSGRAWIDSKDIGTFTRKDIVSVLVNRKTDIQIELLAADVLQRHSTEFSMSDDLYNNDSEEYIAIA